MLLKFLDEFLVFGFGSLFGFGYCGIRSVFLLLDLYFFVYGWLVRAFILFSEDGIFRVR